MDKGTGGEKREYDFSVTAFRVVQEATGQLQPKTKQTENLEKAKDEGKNPHAVALGRLGGLKGGKARAMKLTAGQRSEIARRAAEMRWKGNQT